MENVETKMEKKLGKGFFGKKKPTTIAEATASLQENIDNLKHVHEVREASATRKAEQIEKLTRQREDDLKESQGSKRLAEKLENFFFGELDSE